MKVSKENVLNIADLARLEFDNDQVELFAEELTDVLEYANNLSKVDTSNVVPTTNVLPFRNVFREDRCEESLPREKALKNAPSSENGCFKVSKVIE